MHEEEPSYEVIASAFGSGAGLPDSASERMSGGGGGARSDGGEHRRGRGAWAGPCRDSG